MLGFSILQEAVCGEHVEVCDLLLKQGATINHKNDHGNTALHEAVQCANGQICQLHIDQQADLCATNNKGQTPLALAKGPDPLKSSPNQSLAEAEARKHKRAQTCILMQEAYDTRLIETVKKGTIVEAKKLLHAGADWSCKDKAGTTAVAYAYQSGIAQHCPVCFDDKLKTEFKPLNKCKHTSVCVDCINDQISVALDEKSPAVQVLRCPIEGCTYEMNEKDIRLFTGDEEKVTRYSEVMLALLIAKTKNVRHCPTPDCKFVYIMGKNQKACTFICPSCEKKHCAGCGDAHPENGVCYDVKTKNIDEIKSMETVKEITKICPGCKGHYGKDELCSHTTCKCGHQFCWHCLQPRKAGLHTCKDLVAKEAHKAELVENLATLYGGDMASLEAYIAREEYDAWKDEIIQNHGFLGKVYVVSYDIFVGEYSWITCPVIVIAGIGALFYFVPEWLPANAVDWYNQQGSFGWNGF